MSAEASLFSNSEISMLGVKAYGDVLKAIELMAFIKRPLPVPAPL